MSADFNDVTTGCPSGDGVFDKLMASMKAHLKEEYDAQRIRGSEYTQVYLGGLQGAMAQAIQWNLSAELTANQVLLLQEQIVGQQKQNDLLDEQKALLVAQIANTEANTGILGQQLVNLGEELANMGKQGIILDAQGDQANFTADSLMPEQLNQLVQQVAKTAAEQSILAQKLITEEAQTKDTTSQGLVTGVVGKQKSLYAKQTDGFDRDAEQKAARLITDTWGIAVSSDIDGDSVPTEVAKGKIDEVIRNIRTGASISGDV